MQSPSLRRIVWMLVLFSALVKAQLIVPDQSTLSFTAPVGGSSVAQFLKVSSSGAPLTFSATTVTYNASGNWLSVSPTSGSTPANLVASVNVGSLGQGVYNGSILITSPSATNTPVRVDVTLTVGTPPTNTGSLAVSPITLTFTGQAGGLLPVAQLLNVASSPSAVSFAVAASTTDSFNWLQAQPVNATAPASVTISANTAGLPVGMYYGSITLTPSTGGGVTVPVTLNVTSGTSLSANVSSLQFYYQLGSFLPVPQYFTLTSGGSPLILALTASTNDGTSWLNVSPVFPTTPQTITVTISPGSLPAGIYKGNIHVSAPASANQSLDIPVTLTVGNSPLLTVGAPPGTFVYQTGMQPPAAQTVPISSTTGTLTVAVTSNTQDGSNWLVVSPVSGPTPLNLMIGVNPGSLASGSYTGTVTVSAAGAGNSPVTIPVNLTVNGASTLMVSSQSLTLNYQIGGQNNVLSQPLTVTSTGQPVSFTASTTTTTCGANWLEVFPTTGTTPALLTVAIQSIGLNTPMICTGSVILTPSTGAPIQVAVSMNVSATPLFNISPPTLQFSAPFDGDATASQTVNLSVTDGSNVNFAAIASTTSGGPSWLRVAQSSGATPATLSVSANPANLSAGTYSGSITVMSSALAAAQLIPITFKVTAASNAVVAPPSLSFTQAAGGLAPVPQGVSVTATGPALMFSATTSTADLGQWLFVTPNTGMTPSTLSVSVNGSGLKPGIYNGTVTLALPGAGNSPLPIPVTLTVTGAQTVVADRTALTFSYGAGSTSPLSQQVNVTSTGAQMSLSAAVQPGANWLSVAPASASTPAAFTTTVTPLAALTVGGYNGTVTITPSGGSPIAVSVHLDVTSAPVSQISAVASAASGVRGAISPGEIVTITGDSLGPPEGASLRLLPDGTLATAVAGTQVLFDTVAAPILFTSAHQINTIVPYEVAGHPTVQVVVSYQGVQTQAFVMQTAPAAPGIFTATQSGRGQGAILNQDNTYNGRAIPAAPGSIVQVFATGEGVTDPVSITASVTSGLHTPKAGVSAMVGGAPADVVFAGSAPGAVAGLFQVNVRIPPNAPTGDVPITISVGGVSSQTGVTVAVR